MTAAGLIPAADLTPGVRENPSAGLADCGVSAYPGAALCGLTGLLVDESHRPECHRQRAARCAHTDAGTRPDAA